MRRLYPFEGDVKVLANERREIFGSLLETGMNFIPGFLDFCEHIKERHAIAVASSLERKFLTIVNTTVGLSRLFGDHIYSIEDIGFIAKPRPDIFLHAANKLGIAPSDCVVVEDSPHGVTAAKRAGMRCIAILTSTTRDNLAHADMIVADYSEIDLAALASV